MAPYQNSISDGRTRSPVQRGGRGTARPSKRLSAPASRASHVSYTDPVYRANLPSLAGLRILVIDDQEEARESLGEVLSAAGAQVSPAASVAEVLTWLPQLEPEELPHILVCDIAMPIEDGYTALRRLRAWENDGGKQPLQRLPALALTAFAQREDRIRALTAGFQMHLPKPVAPEELIVVIAMIALRQ